MIFAPRIEAAFGRLTLRGNGPVCARITTMVLYHQDGRSARRAHRRCGVTHMVRVPGARKCTAEKNNARYLDVRSKYRASFYLPAYFSIPREHVLSLSRACSGRVAHCGVPPHPGAERFRFSPRKVLVLQHTWPRCPSRENCLLTTTQPGARRASRLSLAGAHAQRNQ